MHSILGFVNVHKPVGPTSTQVTAQVRRIFSTLCGTKLAAGHLGTLDPAASGVLPVALGKATRLIPLIEDRRKTYVCTLALGRATTTGDAVGETVRETPVPADAASLLEHALPRFIGTIEQIPPMFSAVHYAGKRLYDLARSGVTVERTPRSVVIDDLQVLDADEAVFRLRVVCGEGTYIRTLCEDIGAAMGVAAHMGSLVREGSGPFVLEKSHTLEEIAASPMEALLAPERVIPLPTITLDARGVVDFCAGRTVTIGKTGHDSVNGVQHHVFVHDKTGGFIGIGESHGMRGVAPRKVFA